MIKRITELECKLNHMSNAMTTTYNDFVKEFPYTETNDQVKTSQEIIEDLNSLKSMDRLLCGEVGFGKTEMAMRAAFIAVQNGKQVAPMNP